MINRKVGLYDVLGVDAGASAQEIKAAYRRLAKKSHPDAGGSAQEFGDVKLAHAVLSDPERRARYDRVGELEEPEPNNVEQGALGLIGIMLEAALLSENDPTEWDLVAVMKAVFFTQIAEVNRKLKVTRRSIERAGRMRGRFQRNKPGENAIERVLEWKIAALKRSAHRTTLRIRFCTRALRMMTAFDFRRPCCESSHCRANSWSSRQVTPDANESVEMKRLIMRPNALYKIRVQSRDSGVIAHLEKNDATDAEAIYEAGYAPDDALPSGQIG